MFDLRPQMEYHVGAIIMLKEVMWAHWLRYVSIATLVLSVPLGIVAGILCFYGIMIGICIWIAMMTSIMILYSVGLWFRFDRRIIK